MDPVLVNEPQLNEPAVTADADQQRRTLWQTAWGVVLAASAAFSLGYGASRVADPSVGASRPPAWPLFISVLVVVVSVWFVLAPRLHQWPFEETPGGAVETSGPRLTELTETDDPEAAPLAPFHVDTSQEPQPPDAASPPPA